VFSTGSLRSPVAIDLGPVGAGLIFCFRFYPPPKILSHNPPIAVQARGQSRAVLTGGRRAVPPACVSTEDARPGRFRRVCLRINLSEKSSTFRVDAWASWRPTVRHYDLSVQCALGIGCFGSLLSGHPVEEREFGTVKCCERACRPSETRATSIRANLCAYPYPKSLQLFGDMRRRETAFYYIACGCPVFRPLAFCWRINLSEKSATFRFDAVLSKTRPLVARDR
jgi:hypothetical protein